MKIVITGGGTGGHFYPLLAVVDAILVECREQKILDPRIYYTGPNPYNPKELFDRDIIFVRIPAGKKRINPSGFAIVQNFIDIFKMGFGVCIGLVKIFMIFPDVVFAKGGFSSFPTLFAARVLGIPVVMHESDSVPGRVNLWASKFARKIAISFKESAEFFDIKKTAYTGQPIRSELLIPLKVGAYEYLNLDPNLKTISILGGSTGAKKINDIIIQTLPELVKTYQVVHQTGKANFEIVKGMAKLTLEGATNPDRYKPIDYLNMMSLRMIGGISDVIISRAGSGIFEIAAWGVPSILIPIADSNGDHQRKNAFNYLRAGGCEVIEENNLSGQILLNEIHRILTTSTLQEKMKVAAKNFSTPDAAKTIAHEVLNIALSHEI
ncbi:UDP-N-acetylglucosamine--N-acetylmuramyl-(pentapeptide) pyrophosphoryl-undecaprenol N-acetylglucosamine transferase [Arenimonas sp.]|nr:UDP-N-acetylglucosamine--N-acetylmuramyl-(pentapeptide) pyrophosphoryl-undecaprenol N-acetylglucosamine transferase [Candidatus Parcubacteria bacterium]